MADGLDPPSQEDIDAGPTGDRKSEHVERRETHVYHHSSRDSQNTPPPSPSAPSAPTIQKSILVKEHTGRQIFGLMSFAVVFSLVGFELGKFGETGGVEKANPVPYISSGGRIILGGFVGASLLVGLSHFGDGAAQLAVGLALVTSASAILVYGGPVWKGLGTVFGHGPTKPLTATTPTTPTTTPTATAGALVQAA
jgi:hypothetical protein